MKEKLCKKCNTVKPIEEFGREKKGKDGIRHCCKKCNNLASATWQKANPERRKETAKKCKKGKHKQYNLMGKYGITLETYTKLLLEQKGLCPICQKEIETDPCVDHCHKSTQVRGLLCRSCNGGLGLFKDSIESLARAIEYLLNPTINKIG